MAYKYTRKDIEREARAVARDIRKETGHPAKFVDWKIIVPESPTECLTLAVTVQCYDGFRQRNVAI